MAHILLYTCAYTCIIAYLDLHTIVWHILMHNTPVNVQYNCTHQLYMWQTINLCDNDGTHKHSHPHKCARILHLTARVYVYRGHWSISVYPIETELVYSPCFPAVICMQSSLELFLLTTPCTWSSHVNTGSS